MKKEQTRENVARHLTHKIEKALKGNGSECGGKDSLAWANSLEWIGEVKHMLGLLMKKMGN